MKTMFLILFAFLFFIPLLFENSADACQYVISDNTLQEDFDTYDFIFSGKILKVGDYASYTSITLEFIELWKGQPAEKILLFTCKGDSHGGLKFEEGESYLIFAEKLSSAYPVVTDFGPTKSLSNAKNEVLFLDQKSNITRFHYDDSASLLLQFPLKQFKSGITLNEIDCNKSLILVTKNDGSPACVNLDSIAKLIERKWIGNIDSDSMDERDVGYISLYALLQYAESDQIIAIDFEGPQNHVERIIESYDVNIMSSKSTADGSFSSNHGNITKINLKKFFDENQLSTLSKQGISIYSLGGFTDNTGTYGPFNKFLNNEELQQIGKLMGGIENVN